MNGRRLTVLALAVLALAAAGCGGDDANEAAGDTDTTAVAPPTTDETTTEEADDSTTTDEDVSLSGECAEFAGLGAQITEAMSGGNQGLDEASELFDELASQVPDEIKDDFEVIAENFGKIAEAMKDIDVNAAQPSTEDIAKLQEVTQSLNSAEVQEASKNIEEWAAKNC